MRHTTGLFLVAVLALGVIVAQAMMGRSLDRRQLSPVDTGRRIDLNHEDAATLALLPGIGQAMANRVVASRQSDGPFHTISDLARVKYFRRQAIAALPPYAVCGPATQPALPSASR